MEPEQWSTARSGVPPRPDPGNNPAMPHAAPTLPRPATLTTEAWLLIFALSLPWGGSFLFFRILAGELPSFTIVLGRLALAVILLYPMLRLRGERLDVPWGKFMVMGLLNNVIPFSLFAWASIRITGGEAAILNATTPMFGAIVLRLLAGERLTGARIAGILLGLAGVAVLVGPAARTLGANLWDGNLWADLACLGAALSYGVTTLWGRRLRHIPPFQAATAQCLCSTLMLIPLVALIDQPWTLPMPSWRALGALAGIGWLSTGIAYVVFFRIVAVAGVANVMLVTFLAPVSAMILGAIVLGEGVGWNAIAGMVLIFAGLAAIDGRLLSRGKATA